MTTTPTILSNILTVVVVDAQGKPTAGAQVSIKPDEAAGVTDTAGEFQFRLGSAKKYDITATAGSKTVTVPYYVTLGGSTRLVINPVYVKEVERKIFFSSWYKTPAMKIGGITLGIVIILLIIWKLFRSRRNRLRNRV